MSRYQVGKDIIQQHMLRDNERASLFHQAPVTALSASINHVFSVPSSALWILFSSLIIYFVLRSIIYIASRLSSRLLSRSPGTIRFSKKNDEESSFNSTPSSLLKSSIADVAAKSSLNPAHLTYSPTRRGFQPTPINTIQQSIQSSRAIYA